MGNCLGAPVNNHSALCSTNSSIPDKTSKKIGKHSATTQSNSNVTQNSNVVERTLGETAQAAGRVITPNLKAFTLAELRSATRDFGQDTVLGEGAFGRVFKGWVDENTYAPSIVGVGLAVAVKKSNPDSPQGQGLQECLAEVNFLGKFCHPNLVKLLGYCLEDKQYLLVYEYMQKGSLENHLFESAPEPLTWETRVKIAIGAAEGLVFLHRTKNSVIYRDFKSSNILLDGEYNAKLSDFGLAKLGPPTGHSHVRTRVMGTFGYTAPEYMDSGCLYVKSDVYGFGVVLLEMITGKRVIDSNRADGEKNLVKWAGPYLSKKKKLKTIMDTKLECYPLEAAFQATQLIQKCLASDHRHRPSMGEVLGELIKIKEKR